MRWLCLLLAACATPYHAGTFPPEAQSFGCLDVWLQAGQRSEAVGPVVVIHLGNRCDHSTLVDLGSIRVVGGDDLGAHVDMAPYDPDREIAPRRIDAFVSGEEWIEYHARGAAQPIAWLDVDIGGIAPDARVPDRWVRIETPR